MGIISSYTDTGYKLVLSDGCTETPLYENNSKRLSTGVILKEVEYDTPGGFDRGFVDFEVVTDLSKVDEVLHGRMRERGLALALKHSTKLDDIDIKQDELNLSEPSRQEELGLFDDSSGE